MRAWKLIHIKAKLPARALHHQEKKNEWKICYALGQIYVGSSLLFFCQGMVRTTKMSFYIRKI